MVAAYYNEHDPRAAAWLRELIAEGHIAPGDVDERSITDVTGADLDGYTQAHFFAGIGGWSYALRLAGVPDDACVWTGSCPCQPFSAAGLGRGTDDERHLWPDLARLIGECRPPVVVGEQVASPAGRDWLSAVRADLEGLAYAVGAADLCAAGGGAPHIRQRLYWGGVAHADSARRCERGEPPSPVGGPAAAGRSVRLDHADSAGPQGWVKRGDGTSEWPAGPPGLDAWRPAGWVLCADGRSRPAAPVTRRVDDGIPARVGLLRGYGNAIVPQVGAVFLRALLGLS